MKELLQKAVDFLHGRKATILGLVLVINLFLAKEGIINENTAIMIQGILSVLGIGADAATNKLGVSPEKTLGTMRKS